MTPEAPRRCGDTPARQWLRSRPTLPPRPRRRHAYRVVWACLAVLALVEVLIAVFVP